MRKKNPVCETLRNNFERGWEEEKKASFFQTNTRALNSLKREGSHPSSILSPGSASNKYVPRVLCNHSSQRIGERLDGKGIPRSSQGSRLMLEPVLNASLKEPRCLPELCVLGFSMKHLEVVHFAQLAFLFWIEVWSQPRPNTWDPSLCLRLHRTGTTVHH